MSFPNVKADIIGGLEYYSKASGELVDEYGNSLVWRVSLTVAGQPREAGLVEIEYAADKELRPSRWVMQLLFESLDIVEAELITQDQHANSESV